MCLRDQVSSGLVSNEERCFIIVLALFYVVLIASCINSIVYPHVSLQQQNQHIQKKHELFAVCVPLSGGQGLGASTCACVSACVLREKRTHLCEYDQQGKAHGVIAISQQHYISIYIPSCPIDILVHIQ